MAALCSQGYGYGFEGSFGVAGWDGGAHPGDGFGQDAVSHSRADLKRKIEGAGEEGVDDDEVPGGEPGEAVGGKEAGCGLGCFPGLGRGKEVARAGLAGVKQGLAVGALVDDEGAGGEVAETLVALVGKHGDEAGEVEVGEEVGGAEQVAREAFKEGDAAAGVLDDAELHGAFAGGLAVPKGFEQGEIAPVEQESRKDYEGDEPFAGEGFDVFVIAEGGEEDHEHEPGGKDDAELDQAVEQKRDKAAADAGDGEGERDLLGGIDAKLIGKALAPKTGEVGGWTEGTATGCGRCFGCFAGVLPDALLFEVAHGHKSLDRSSEG